jgi:hypothetical protein
MTMSTAAAAARAATANATATALALATAAADAPDNLGNAGRRLDTPASWSAVLAASAVLSANVHAIRPNHGGGYCLGDKAYIIAACAANVATSAASYRLAEDDVYDRREALDRVEAQVRELLAAVNALRHAQDRWDAAIRAEEDASRAARDAGVPF